MKGEFSFCGVDIADIGLEYAPENKNTYVYAPAVSNVHEETFDGHDGGYTYGAYRDPKEFVLRCYYQDTHVAKGLMARVYNLFKVGRKGMLVFKRRPWCYYYATVTEVNAEDMFSYLNGIFVITMKAYYPYARGLSINDHLFYNLTTDDCHDEIMLNTAIFDKEEMVPPTSFTNISSQTSVLLYNPGTERAKVGIVIAGTAGDGVTIHNRTTNQSCRYIAFTSTDGDIETDPINGKTVSNKNGTKTLSFLFHDYGFIELEPAFPILRDLYATYSNSKNVTMANMLYQDEDEKDWYVDKYIYLESQWRQINKCLDKHTLQLKQKISESGSCKTSVVSMNEIVITPTNNSQISKLNFVYAPTYA